MVVETARMQDDGDEHKCKPAFCGDLHIKTIAVEFQVIGHTAVKDHGIVDYDDHKVKIEQEIQRRLDKKYGVGKTREAESNCQGDCECGPTLVEFEKDADGNGKELSYPGKNIKFYTDKDGDIVTKKDDAVCETEITVKVILRVWGKVGICHYDSDGWI